MSQRSSRGRTAWVRFELLARVTDEQADAVWEAINAGLIWQVATAPDGHMWPVAAIEVRLPQSRDTDSRS